MIKNALCILCKGRITRGTTFFHRNMPVISGSFNGDKPGKPTSRSHRAFSSPVPKLPSMTPSSNSLSAGGPFSLVRVCHVLLFLTTFFVHTYIKFIRMACQVFFSSGFATWDFFRSPLPPCSYSGRTNRRYMGQPQGSSVFHRSYLRS